MFFFANYLRPTVLVALIGLLAACSDQPTLTAVPITRRATLGIESGRPGPLLTSANRSNSIAALANERTAGEAIARVLAMALQDPGVREQVKHAMASSAAKEHKLHFASFLQGRGGDILAAGLRNAGIKEIEFQRAIAEVRPLEFYMPVHSHSRAWNGGSDLMVAVAVQKEESPVGFRLDGSRVALSKTSPPSTPTLVLTQVETNFAEQIPQNLAGRAELSCESVAGEPLDGASKRCEASRAGAVQRLAGNLLSMPAGRRLNISDDPQVVGLYANFLRVVDAKEYWFEGDPEIEIHVTGKRNGPSGSPIDYQCAGESASNALGGQPGIRDFPYVFDMNDNFWQGQEVRILNAAQLDSLQTAEPAGFNVSLWEDDDMPCIVRQNGATFFHDAVLAAQAIARGVNAVRAAGGPNYGVLAGTIGEIAALIQGGDDYLGLLVFKDSTSYAGTNPGNTHMIFDGATQNGRATLFVKRASRSASVSGPSSVGAYSTSQWSASAGGSSGTVTYDWIINGESVQSGTSDILSYQNTGASFSLGVIASDPTGAIGTSSMEVTVCSDPTVLYC